MPVAHNVPSFHLLAMVDAANSQNRRPIGPQPDEDQLQKPTVAAMIFLIPGSESGFLSSVSEDIDCNAINIDNVIHTLSLVNPTSFSCELKSLNSAIDRLLALREELVSTGVRVESIILATDSESSISRLSNLAK